jgi:phospholipid/cholesterol/gamma-HCH transport system substrate-binding protein
MPRVEHWSQLKVGLLVLAGIIAVAAAVLSFARIGALHGKTTRLYLVTDVASGVLDGTEVWLAGKKIGLVRSVELRPPATDTSERIAIAMDVLNPYVRYIRRNSDVRIQPGGRLIGSPVVYIDVGTAAAPGVSAGDTIRARAQIQARSGLADASSLGDSLTGIAATISTVKREFDSTANDLSGLGKMSSRQAGTVRVAFGNLSRRALSSRGSVAGVVQDSARLRAEAAHVSALADSIGIAANGSGEIGRFRRDSTLVLQARQTLASVTDLRRRVARYAGRSDDGAALAAQLDRARAQLDSIVKDARSHPLRYITF